MKFILYRGKNGDWYWRLLARNKRVIAISGEGYKRKCDAVRMINRISQYTWGVEIVEKP